MRLYLTSAGWCGTQAEARAFGKDFDQIEVPTDKAGLIAFLNGQFNATNDLVESRDEVIAAATPVVVPVQSYADFTTRLDDAVAAAPLAQRLTWASLALEDARTALHPAEHRKQAWGQPAGELAA